MANKDNESKRTKETSLLDQAKKRIPVVGADPMNKDEPEQGKRLPDNGKNDSIMR